MKPYFLSLILLSLIASPSHAFHVVLDPGHGGTDHGAVRNKNHESTITLQVAQLVENELKNLEGFTVTMTRDKDVYVSLEDRASIANQTGDVFLSIHVNSSRDPKARGKEIYFQNQLPPDQESLFLASRENQTKTDREVVRAVSLNIKKRPHLNRDVRAIVEDLERNHRLKLSGLFAEKLFHNWQGDRLHRRRSIRQAPFFVVSNVDKPAALIEIGYLSHPEESKKLLDPDYQKKVARGIVQSLIEFKEIIDKPSAKSLN